MTEYIIDSQVPLSQKVQEPSQRKIDYTLLLIDSQALNKVERIKTRSIKENVLVLENSMKPAMVEIPEICTMRCQVIDLKGLLCCHVGKTRFV